MTAVLDRPAIGTYLGCGSAFGLPEILACLGFVAGDAEALPVVVGVGATVDKRPDVVYLHGKGDPACCLAHGAQRVLLELTLAYCLKLPTPDAWGYGVIRHGCGA